MTNLEKTNIPINILGVKFANYYTTRGIFIKTKRLGVDSATSFQILNETVCVSHRTNNLTKNMNPAMNE